MKIEVVFGILSRIGFSSISRETLNTEVLELEVLLAQNQSNQQTFVEYISNIDADGVQELCDVPGFVELLRRSCTRHDLVFPGFDSYTMVCAKDRKQLGGDVENGLYNYIDKFIAELQMPFKSMKRKDFSKAYILQLQGLDGHLTIDAFYQDREHTSYSAHISFEKDGYQVRVYFDEKLNHLKTTATVEEGGKKIQQVVPSSLNVMRMDYLPFFDQLSQLMTAYQKKINQLDVDITSKFMFIRTEQDKKVCLKLIQDLCVLKSPFVDQRLGIIQKWEQPRPAAFVQSIQDKDDAIPESDVKEAVEPKRVISPQELKKQRKAAAEHEINTQIGLIGQELLSDELSAETLKQCFQQILDLEFLLIQHYDEIKEKQQTFNENIDKFKSACIDVMYHAISSRNTDFMEEIYRQGHYFVDSLVIGSINEFPQTVLQEKSSRSSNERAKKLLSLFRYMFDKNDLCRVFFETSKLVTFKQNCMLTIFASMINYDEGPDYVLFLLDQGLVSPTECVGIYEQHFISLQQYILILMLTSKSLGYEALWQRFSENKSDFLTIEKKERFTWIMHENKKFSFIQAEQEKKTKSTKSSPDLSFEDVNKLLKHEIGHAKDFSYEFLNAIFSSVSDKMHCLKVNQLIISKDAVYAFWLLGSLGNHHEIQQVSCLSPPQEKRIFIFEKCLEPHQDVKSLFGIKSKSTPVNQLLIGFFPINNSSVGTNEQLVFMSRVLDFVLQQEWMKSDEAADIVNKGLMINFSKQSEHHEKSNISLGAEMYFVAMRGISDVFFQKICYWKACCLEGVAQDNKTDLRLKLIGLLLIQIKDISIQKNTLLFVVGKIKHMRDETPTIRAFREKSLMLTQSTDCRKQISCGDPAPEEMVAASMPVPQTLHPRMTCKKYFQLFLGLWSAVSIGNELYKKELIQPLAALNLLASVLGIIAIIALHHKKKENIDEVTQPRAKH